MRSRSKLAALAAASVLLLPSLVRAQAPADESTLLALWKNFTPTNLEGTVRACAAFNKQFTNSPLREVTLGVVGWCALQLGDRGDTVTRVFESMLSSDDATLDEAATTMARRWLTRLDREKVEVGLRKVYIDLVSYPPTLEALTKLPEGQRPPLTDRWGRPWRYRLAEQKHIRGLGQKYVLESVNVDRDHDLKDALGKTYEAATLLKPQKVLSREKGRESVAFAAGREPVVLAVGGRFRGVTLVHVGQTLVVLTDDDHWSVLPLP